MEKKRKNARIELEMLHIFKKFCKFQFFTDFHDFGWK